MFPNLFLLIMFFCLIFWNWYHLIKLDFFDDESGDDGSGSGSAGMFAFPLRCDKSVGSIGVSIGRVSDMESGVFVPTGIE